MLNKLEITIDNNKDTKKAIEDLKKRQDLVEIEISFEDLTVESIVPLLDSLKQQKSLKKIEFAGDNLAKPIFEKIVDFLKTNQTITNFICAGIYDLNRIKLFANALVNNHFITHISITSIWCVSAPEYPVNPITGSAEYVANIPKAGPHDTYVISCNYDLHELESENSTAFNLINTSIKRNREFARQCAALEKKFQVFATAGITPQSQTSRQEETHSILLDSMNDAPELSGNTENPELNEKQANALFDLLQEMLKIAESLKKTGYSAADALLDRVKWTEAQFYLRFDQLAGLFDLYRDYFLSHPHPEFNFQLAEKISLTDDTATLNRLGLATPRLKYQYILKLLEGNKTPGNLKLYRSAYLKLQEKNDDPDNQTTEETIKDYIASIKAEEIAKIHLKRTLAQNLGDGVYANSFNSALTTEAITPFHSRILSAERLATLSPEYSHAEMVKILQIEYAALPNDDKQDSESFFTRYRHRTLEKALEHLFKKENITPLGQAVIETDGNLKFASAILQWIGEQERSFYYKTSKNQNLFASMKALGKVAHQLIVCDKKDLSKLNALENEVETQLATLPSQAVRMSLDIATLSFRNNNLIHRIDNIETVLKKQ